MNDHDTIIQCETFWYNASNNMQDESKAMDAIANIHENQALFCEYVRKMLFSECTNEDIIRALLAKIEDENLQAVRCRKIAERKMLFAQAYLKTAQEFTNMKGNAK